MASFFIRPKRPIVDFAKFVQRERKMAHKASSVLARPPKHFLLVCNLLIIVVENFNTPELGFVKDQQEMGNYSSLCQTILDQGLT